MKVIQQALVEAGLPQYAAQAVTDPDRNLVMQLLKLDRYVDMLILRGGAVFSGMNLVNSILLSPLLLEE